MTWSFSAEGRLVLVLLAHAGVDLAHRAVHLVGSRQCVLDRLALRFDSGDLLSDEVAEGLQRVHVAAQVADGVLRAVQAVHRLLDAGDAPLLVLQVAAQLVAPPIQRLHLGGGELLRVDVSVLLLAHSGELFAGRFDLPPQRIGAVLELLEWPLDVEEGGQPILELGCQVDLLAEVLEDRTDPLRVFEGAGDLGLGLLLILGEVGGAVVQALQHLRELDHPLEAPLEISQARGESIHAAGHLLDGLAELTQPIGREVGVLGEGLVAADGRLHVAEDGLHLRKILGVGSIAEQIPEHRTLLGGAARLLVAGLAARRNTLEVSLESER